MRFGARTRKNHHKGTKTQRKNEQESTEGTEMFDVIRFASANSVSSVFSCNSLCLGAFVVNLFLRCALQNSRFGLQWADFISTRSVSEAAAEASESPFQHQRVSARQPASRSARSSLRPRPTCPERASYQSPGFLD